MSVIHRFWRPLWIKQGLKLAIVAAIATSLLLLPGIPLDSRSLALAQQLAVATQPVAGPAYIDLIVEEVDKDRDRLEELFKDIHQHPELAFKETRTAEIVAKELKESGYEVYTGVGNRNEKNETEVETGVVGILKNGSGPIVMFRADMDALPVEEATGLDYASEEEGLMHACGHDAHTVWMMGMAKAMAELKSEWSGTLIVVGQPAEEGVAGARAMVTTGENKGLYDLVPVPDYLLGMHRDRKSVV